MYNRQASNRKTYVVKQGDYLARIADSNGLSIEDIWDDPQNKELSERRQNHNLLLPGEDVLILPPSTRKPPSMTAGQSNSYTGPSTKVRVNVTFCDLDETMIGEECEVAGLGEPYTDTTDESGRLVLEINTRTEQVLVTFAARGVAFRVLPGYLLPLLENNDEPLDNHSGAQQRLANLGYTLPRPRGALAEALTGLLSVDKEDELFTSAVRAFQRTNPDLPKENGSLDEATALRLADVYGC